MAMSKGTKEAMFSSKTDDWSTPKEFFNKLDITYKFTLDPCSTAMNAKCRLYFTEETNGLEESWEGHHVFMNPPYGRDIGKWIKKAFEESQKENTMVVALIPSRTDTKYWHDYCMKANMIYFVKGRLKFGESKNSAPFPSAVVVFTGGKYSPFIGVMTPK